MGNLKRHKKARLGLGNLKRHKKYTPKQRDEKRDFEFNKMRNALDTTPPLETQ